jgi:hypothetical protein
MKKLIWLSLFLIHAVAWALSDMPDFPAGPDRAMTPGVLCTSPTEYRYPEHIAYCARAVDGTMKQQIFNNYRAQGYKLAELRDHYKIDHFFPLCAGGANEIGNLWPQHESIFTVTDEIEFVGCQKLAAARIKQKDLFEFIKKAKYDNSKVPEVLKYLYSL